ncbi:hypothetical protein KZZ52_53710 [Dactylosporangium sp. AC04546]|uniref:hypothetical protein n=1 Tax=Dactylosporangium sp. AC04546 TaxID=2862460 RepID=UPI001EDE28BA|nr:hypothetical protein [Dactylosporangium sp. AC04546]WVK82712.1 hypothetical protein KZZ52_53710 [Dactylosporangium sp. AC04546]
MIRINPQQHPEPPMTFATSEPNTGQHQIPPQPVHRRSPTVLIAVIAAAVVLLLAVIAAAAYGVWLRTSPSQDDAQRECRTAVEREFRTRVERASSDKQILVTVSGIDMDETVKTSDGYQVNYTVHYAATAALVGSVPNTLSLTCNAKIKNRKLTTEVVNRS